MEQFRQVWATVAEHISKVAERVHDLPADQVRLVAALACLASLLVLIAWVVTLRKLRTTRKDLVEARAHARELQAKYEAEVKWRTATERIEAKAAQAARTPVPPYGATQQAPGVMASAQFQAADTVQTTSNTSAPDLCSSLA